MTVPAKYHKMEDKTGSDPTEFEVQSEAYHRLKKEYHYVRGEFSVRIDSNISRACRFDIVVMDAYRNWLCVVEVKRHGVRGFEEQLTWYRTVLSCPVIVISGMEEAAQAVELVKAAIAKGPNYA